MPSYAMLSKCQVSNMILLIKSFLYNHQNESHHLFKHYINRKNKAAKEYKIFLKNVGGKIVIGKKQIIGDLGPSNGNGRLLNKGKELKNM